MLSLGHVTGVTWKLRAASFGLGPAVARPPDHYRIIIGAPRWTGEDARLSIENNHGDKALLDPQGCEGSFQEWQIDPETTAGLLHVFQFVEGAEKA